MLKKEGFYIEEYILFAVLFYSALTDWRSRRIPNWWILVGIVGGIAYGGLGFVIRAVSVVLVSFILFYYRMMGAGDLKLCALICGYLGWGRGCMVILLGLTIGAVWSVVRLMGQKKMGERFWYFYAYIGQMIQHNKKTAYFDSLRDGYGGTIPLAACMLLGFLAEHMMR